MIVLAPHLLPGRICQQDVNRRLMRKLGRNKNDFSQHCHTQGSLIKMLLAGEIKWWDILTSGFSFSVPNSLKNILNHLWNFRFSLYHLCELQHSELYIFFIWGCSTWKAPPLYAVHSAKCVLWAVSWHLQFTRACKTLEGTQRALLHFSVQFSHPSLTRDPPFFLSFFCLKWDYSISQPAINPYISMKKAISREWWKDSAISTAYKSWTRMYIWLSLKHFRSNSVV